MSSALPFPPATRLLDRGDGPLYRQLANHLRAAISSEALGIGDALPKEGQLAESFGVSLVTVRQALRDLAQDGLIRKRPAKTAVVAARAPLLRPSANLNSLADIVANTADARLELSSWRQERSRRAAAAFALRRDAASFCLRGRLLTGAGPVAVVTIYFPPGIGARLVRADFDDVVVFRSVQRRLGIAYAGGRLTVRAALARPRLAAALGCRIGAALLVHELIYFGSGGDPVELTIAHHRGDRHSITYDLKPD